MDKYDYVIAKPEMEEVLYHAGFHKYIDKYLGKNGKWIYKYAGQAKNAVSGAVNKAKTMLPGLQKQATGAVSTARKQASSMMSTGRKTASAAKKQAQKRINAMLPILSKKFNSAKKKARSQAAGVKLVARDKTKKLKKQADGTYKNVQKKAKGAYYSGKSKVSSAATKARRKLKGMSPNEISYDKGKVASGWTDDGKARSTTRPYGNRKYKRTGESQLYNNGYSTKAIQENYITRRGNTVHISSPGAASDANRKYSRLHRQGKKVTAAKANTFRNRKIKNRNSKRK